MSTAIQWTDETWNPTTGCSRVSEGCRNCYIERTPPFRMNGRKLGDPVQLHHDRLDAPLHWKKPRRVFVNSLSDLFHGNVPDQLIDQVFTTIALTPRHTYQVLTKRPGRMRDYLKTRHKGLSIFGKAWEKLGYMPTYDHQNISGRRWPFENLWLGVSIEDQKTADERIPILLQTPAAVRWISAEPLLAPVDLTRLRESTFNALDGIDFEDIGDIRDCGDLSKGNHPPGLDWVVAGGESGPGARPCDVAWIRSIVEQCKAAAVPCFVKQLGSNSNHRVPGEVHAAMTAAPIECKHGYDVCPTCDRRRDKLWDKKGGDPDEWPADLRVREYPTVQP